VTGNFDLDAIDGYISKRNACPLSNFAHLTDG